MKSLSITIQVVPNTDCFMSAAIVIDEGPPIRITERISADDEETRFQLMGLLTMSNFKYLIPIKGE